MTISCAICGKTNVKISLSTNYCKECLLKEGILEKIKPIKITICKNCFSIKRNKWIKFKDFSSFQNFLKELIKTKIILKRFYIITNLQVNYQPFLNKINVLINYYIKDFEEFSSLNVIIPITLNKTLCDECFKQKVEDYEVLIQLRTKEVGIIEEFNNLINSYDNIGLIKKEIFNYGGDYYFTNISNARKLIKNFIKFHKIQVKETLSTKKGGKYRHTILLKF